MEKVCARLGILTETRGESEGVDHFKGLCVDSWPAREPAPSASVDVVTVCCRLLHGGLLYSQVLTNVRVLVDLISKFADNDATAYNRFR